MRHRFRSLFFALAGLVGCSDENVERACQAGVCPPPEATGHQVDSFAVYRALDLLVIVDDSQPAAATSSAWAALWPDLGAELEDPASYISLHVRALSASGCGQPGTCTDDGSSMLSSTVCGTARNFRGSLADGLACMASPPVTTCQEVRPLEQLRHFAETAASEGDFLRPDAFLTVLILAGTDDASAIAPTAAVEALRAVGPEEWKIALIVVGPNDCSGARGPTAPRLFDAVKAAGGAYVSQCSPFWKSDVLNLLAFNKPNKRVFCLGPLRDVDPAQPGLQPLLRVADESHSEDGSSRSGEISSCATSAPPCWNWQPSPFCPVREGIFTVDRPKEFCPGLTRTVVDFFTCAVPDDPACAVPP